MSWSPDHKERSRQRILITAARLFAQQGFDKVSIDQVMSEAGMTRGAFYAHFSSKSELYGEAILAAARNARDSRLRPGAEPDKHLERVVTAYLSGEHISGDSLHCPLAFLVSDIAQRDEQVRDIWTRVFRGLVEVVRQEPDEQGYARALQRVVMMIGGVAVARALNDDSLSQTLLETCRSAILDDILCRESGDDHADRAHNDEGKAPQVARAELLAEPAG
ncbi:TetR/AcrR family transcriptional regulator [Marinobacterium sp. D7]|uniref:TetR/AcrR family transcriptional regulator n=1 Tax=Marinobacterium ramblicola TaxID=2849041 RepID=UPI001C2CC617|nr:TetR/AcrR family transcriptional regulator [Marinobacterium ramblicola]MBV1787996.1 TetR/AcrR family transcriptional regulator [Marinobacterium ramblicola]